MSSFTGREKSESVQTYRAGRYFTSNASNALLGSIGGGILLLAIAGMVIWESPDRRGMAFAGLMFLVVTGTMLAFFPGNIAAAFPYAVEIFPGKSLKLSAPLRRIEIPVEDIRDVRHSLLRQGYVVRLKHRHGLLRSFVIHSFFGPTGPLLARAIQKELEDNREKTE